MRQEVFLGVIGGTGLYDMEALEQPEEVTVDTPFGPPSDAIVVGRLSGTSVAFLPRHGRGHGIIPGELNFRANIYALKKLGARAVIAVSAVGSLKESFVPGDLVVPDQFIDRTIGRPSTFFGDGLVVHVSFADPVCAQLSRQLAAAAENCGGSVHRGGTYVCIEGPQFSTRAESRMYRSWGGEVIGMTNLPEARLAREAEMCFATLALVTDYDSWRDGEEGVDAEQIIRILSANSQMARRVVKEAAAVVERSRECACGRALDNAVVTDRKLIPSDRLEKLAPILQRVLNVGGED